MCGFQFMLFKSILYNKNPLQINIQYASKTNTKDKY
jgi:hypothetical protein